MTTDPTVYILGAGCSAACGYPLGSGFLTALEEFAKNEIFSVNERQRIKQAVVETAKLLAERRLSTIDALVSSLNNERFNANLGYGQERIDHERTLDDQIYDAQIATLALFLWLEPNALKRLNRYEELLYEIFPGHEHWQRKVAASNFRVLTFNYDRLFEIAFVKRYRIDVGQFPIYGDNVLNSGLMMADKQGLFFAENRFCFLKLHGSIQIATSDEYGKSNHHYHCEGLTSETPRRLVDDDYYPRLTKSIADRRPVPLIVFPDLRDYVRSNENRFPYREYITKVWEQAEKIVAAASQIRVVGYSFAPIDRAAFLKLLCKTRPGTPIVVHNLDAERICAEIKSKHADLDLNLIPHQFAF